MASSLDVKSLVKHLANGSFGENLCRVCLAPLPEFCENVFTSICKEGKEYCIADVLKELCDIQIADSDHYNVCPSCYTAASNAYKFYLNAKANDDVLHFYMDELSTHVDSIEVPDNITAESICISLPLVFTEYFDYDIKDISKKQSEADLCKELDNMTKKTNTNSKVSVKKDIKVEKVDKKDEEEIVVIVNEKGQPSFFIMCPDGRLVKKEYDEKCKKVYKAIPQNNTEKKTRRKREPMTSKKCPRCPIRYRFIAKLKDHMRMEHAAILYSCKICEALTEDIDEHEFHLKTHTNNYECDICNVMFKKRETMIDHIKEHKETGLSIKSDFVCKMCGLILSDEESLNSHTDLNHYKKYACYYCGRTYKGIGSFEKHVKKHEMYLKPDSKRKQQMPPPAVPSSLTCELCGRGFRGERALLWHMRLHTNERPFTCDVCGRGFVSVNRRNQHALCAHSVPTRRCPLCPALFHLRSMVNTHIKKVHLKRHKRRTRCARPAHVFWATAPVPVQELSVALQGDILELQARGDPQEDLDTR